MHLMQKCQRPIKIQHISMHNVRGPSKSSIDCAKMSDAHRNPVEIDEKCQMPIEIQSRLMKKDRRPSKYLNHY